MTELSICLMGARGPVPTLLLHLCNLYLDSFILNVITDPAILYKLLIEKLGAESDKAILIKILRQCRNKIEHGECIPDDEYKLYFDAITEIYIQLSRENFHEENKKRLQLQILHLCMEILNANQVSQPTNINKKNTSNEMIGSLIDFRNYHRDEIKGKKIIFLDGEFINRSAIFVDWNNNKAKVIINNRFKNISLSRQIKIIN